jgi:large subunit ribosomal protein L5
MATKDKEQKDQRESKKGKGGGDKKGESPKHAHAGAGIPAPAPRLRTYYQNTVRERLSKQFELSNPHQIPGLEKIVLNVGLGEAI